MQRRWFISYHSPDGALAGQLKNAIAAGDIERLCIVDAIIARTIGLCRIS
jgi:hypothetical protein